MVIPVGHPTGTDKPKDKYKPENIHWEKWLISGFFRRKALKIIERIIEQSKDRYYETLEQSSQGWHEGKNDPWPYINYVLYTLKTAYHEFEERVGQLKSPKGAKTELIKTAINSFPGEFTLSDLERACPSVSRDMIRRVLRELQRLREVECLGRGPGALWKKRGNTLKRG